MDTFSPDFSPQELDLDSFLESLRAAGSTESSGAFTLDQSEVRRKLRQYQLSEPHYYVAPLLASAYLGGADRIEVQVDYQGIVLQWDGQLVTRFEMENLFTSLLAGGSDPGQRRLRELAVGMNAAWALNPRRLRLRSGDLVLELGASAEKVLGDQPPVVGTRVEVEHRAFRGLQRRWRRQLVGRLPEERVVDELCPFAAPHLTLNGRVVDPPGHGRVCLATGFLAGGSSIPEGMLLRGLPEAPVRRRVSGPGPHCALLTLHRPGSPNLGLRVVLDGVLFNFPSYDLGVPGIACLLVAPQLVKNLSSSEIVANDDWIRLYQSLRGEAFALAKALVDGWGELTAAQRQQSIPALQALTRHHLKEKDAEQARQATRRVLGLFEQSGGPRDQAYADAVYSALLLQSETQQMDAYRRGIHLFVEWLAPLLGVRIRRNHPHEADLMALDYRIEGERHAVEQAHLFLLKIEQRVLGPEHVVTLERMEQLRRLYSIWGWEKKLPPVLARLHSHIDQSVVPGLSDQSRYWA